MKKLFSLIALFVCMSMQGWAQVDIDATHFPDAVWRNYISTTYDTNSDGILDETELATIASVKTLGTVGVAALSANNVPFCYTTYKNETTRIHNLKGIEYFTGLEQLNIRGNNVEQLDLSANKQLKVINLHFNELLTSVTLPEVEHANNCSIYVAGCFKLQELDLTPLGAQNKPCYIGTGHTVAQALTFTTAPTSSTNMKVLSRIVLPANLGNTTLALNNAGFSSNSKIVSLDVDFSHVTTSAMTTLNMTSSGISSINTDAMTAAVRNKLTTINLTSATKLADMRIANCPNLTTLTEGNSSELSTMELSNLPKLKCSSLLVFT